MKKLEQIKNWLFGERRTLSASEAFTKYAVNGNPDGVVEVLTKGILDRIYRESDNSLEILCVFPTYSTEQLRKDLMAALVEKGYAIPYSDDYVFIVRWRQ